MAYRRKRSGGPSTLSAALDVRFPLALLFERAVDIAWQHLGASEMILAGFLPDSNDVGFVIGHSRSEETITELSRLQKAVFQRTVKNPAPYWNNSPGSDAKLAEFSSIVKGGISAVACVPIPMQDGLAGFLYATFADGRRFDEKTQEYLSCFGQFLGGMAEAHDTYVEIETELAQKVAAEGHRFGSVTLYGTNPDFVECMVTARKAAPYGSPVLLTGESGTGKSTLARAMHEAGDRKAKTFVTLDCSATAENQFDLELFGYVQGAFPGAEDNKRGKAELANGGTLFVREITDMPLTAQAGLLRLMETKKSTRMGDTEPHDVDVRVIASTNQNIKLALSQGRLRKDLYYRLAGVTIELPALRDRREDIAILGRHFLQLSENNPASRPMDFTEEALRLLNSYPWPGNLRELRQVSDTLLIFLDPNVRVVSANELPQDINPEQKEETTGLRHLAPMKRSERQLIIQALRKHRGNKKTAAAHLRIARATLYRKIEEYGIAKEDYKGPAVANL